MRTLRAITSLRSSRSIRNALVAAAFIATAGQTAALAAGPSFPADGSTVVLAKWQVKGGRVSVQVPLAEALTSKQKDMIGGGFTTVSVLTLKLLPETFDPKRDDEDDLPLFYGVRCSVKFDAWEDTYDVARLDDRPKAALLKTFGAYGEMCLTAELDREGELDRLRVKGGTLIARLVVKQTSPEEADRIKEWLIQQQSGVMQSLFSHMLGELTLNQTLTVKISVPPEPEALEKSPSVKQETKDVNRDGKRKG